MNSDNLQKTSQRELRYMHKVNRKWLALSLISLALAGGTISYMTIPYISLADETSEAQGQTYDYANLVEKGAVKTLNISWKYNDGDEIPTGSMDYANPNGKTSIFFNIGAGKLKAGDVIRIPVKTNLANQPGTQTFNISNLNPVIYDAAAKQGISKSVRVSSDGQYIEVPLDGDGFDSSTSHDITINFTANGGSVFPKTAGNGTDLSFSETIADQTHTYHWAPKPTSPNFTENNTVGPMQNGVSSMTNTGISIGTSVSNTDGNQFTQAVPLNDGNDYIQTIVVTATTLANGQVIPVVINPSSLNHYVAVSSDYGPATEAPGWTDQAANNWGGTSNANSRIANWFNRTTDETVAENNYSVVKLADNSYKITVNFGKSQSLAYSKSEFETIIKSQYASVSDQVIKDMEERYGDGNGNVIMPYSIKTLLSFTNPNNTEDSVKYDISFADNKGIQDNKSVLTTPINHNTAAGESELIVRYVDATNGDKVLYESSSFGFESHNDQFSAKSSKIDNYVLDTSKLPEGAKLNSDGQYELDGTFKADWENGKRVITYYYNGDEAKVKVRYVLDKDSNTNTVGDWVEINSGLDDEILSGHYHQEFTTTAKDFSSEGYSLVQVINGPTGNFDGTDNQTVTYVYAAYHKLYVDYVDQDNNNQKIDGDTYTYTNDRGMYNVLDNYRTSPTIAILKSKGYELVSDPYPSTGYTFASNLDSDFTVVLKHRIDQSEETKTVNEDVHYQYADGSQAAETYTKALTFTRTVSTDAVTGVKTYGSWSVDQTFDAVKSPELKGYTADKAEINAQTVNGDSGNLNYVVTYTKDAPITASESKTINEVIHYQYADGSQAAETYTKALTFTRIVSTDAVTGVKTYGAWSADQTFDAVKSPELKGYTADKAEINSQTVNGDTDDLNYVVTYTKDAPGISNETRTVNETIHYQYTDGSQAAETYTKALTFTRTVSTDAVTGVKTYGSWSVDQTFDAVESPQLKGYTADKAEINAQTVNGNSSDLNYTVTYTKDAPNISSESKTINESIHYQYADGSQAAEVYTKALTFTRTVLTDPVTGEKTYSDWGESQVFDAVESPKLKGYTADKGEISAQTVNGNSSDLNYVVTYTKNAPIVFEESKTVNETINYQYSDGSQAADTFTKALTFTRKVSVDAVTEEKSYGSWSEAQTFDAVKSPELKGYTADKKEISAQTVDALSSDLNYKVVYTKNTNSAQANPSTSPSDTSKVDSKEVSANNPAINQENLPSTGISLVRKTSGIVALVTALVMAFLGVLFSYRHSRKNSEKDE
ncbi:hypothetical protein OZX68_00850 [Streptococcaceae bacterium ESL0729]|nr:hypothetical protein OZX68_00850 [Streptococcaceae bacterium ESL0729]